MKKKILAIALTFVMAAAFCACGTEKTPASADGSADAAKGSGEEVTLYLSAAASMTESMDKAIAAYEKENPGVKIQATYRFFRYVKDTDHFRRGLRYLPLRCTEADGSAGRRQRSVRR